MSLLSRILGRLAWWRRRRRKRERTVSAPGPPAAVGKRAARSARPSTSAAMSQTDKDTRLPLYLERKPSKRASRAASQMLLQRAANGVEEPASSTIRHVSAYNPLAASQSPARTSTPTMHSPRTATSPLTPTLRVRYSEIFKPSPSMSHYMSASAPPPTGDLWSPARSEAPRDLAGLAAKARPGSSRSPNAALVDDVADMLGPSEIRKLLERDERRRTLRRQTQSMPVRSPERVVAIPEFHTPETFGSSSSKTKLTPKSQAYERLVRASGGAMTSPVESRHQRVPSLPLATPPKAPPKAPPSHVAQTDLEFHPKAFSPLIGGASPTQSFSSFAEERRSSGRRSPSASENAHSEHMHTPVTPGNAGSLPPSVYHDAYGSHSSVPGSSGASLYESAPEIDSSMLRGLDDEDFLDDRTQREDASVYSGDSGSTTRVADAATQTTATSTSTPVDRDTWAAKRHERTLSEYTDNFSIGHYSPIEQEKMDEILQRDMARFRRRLAPRGALDDEQVDEGPELPMPSQTYSPSIHSVRAWRSAERGRPIVIHTGRDDTHRPGTAYIDSD